MKLADVIRAARKDKRLSQRALAARLQVSPSAVAQWELGTTTPSIESRVDLAAELQIPFSDLVPEFAQAEPVTLTDPQTIILVRRFSALPPKLREAILMQVVATADSLQDEPPDSSEKN